jgi:hypothetical protein
MYLEPSGSGTHNIPWDESIAALGNTNTCINHLGQFDQVFPHHLWQIR